MSLPASAVARLIRMSLPAFAVARLKTHAVLKPLLVDAASQAAESLPLLQIRQPDPRLLFGQPDPRFRLLFRQPDLRFHLLFRQ
ncbi:hypothetical protein TNCT_673271 [Trichonephila clavata]|uniref:Uncharacterized protein n=1 Tax=Trichonephila clavata TaxID=2740835 RepID=A0A8X6LGS1_TRICU|nr:hypothetical protein TNCT_673271 [Trichonephila clavata]